MGEAGVTFLIIGSVPGELLYVIKPAAFGWSVMQELGAGARQQGNLLFYFDPMSHMHRHIRLGAPIKLKVFKGLG